LVRIGGGEDSAADGAGDNTSVTPCVPTVWSVGVIELFVGLEVQIALHTRDGKYKSDLRADADDAGFEGTQLRSAAPVWGKLIVDRWRGCADTIGIDSFSEARSS